MRSLLLGVLLVIGCGSRSGFDDLVDSISDANHNGAPNALNTIPNQPPRTDGTPRDASMDVSGNRRMKKEGEGR